MCSIDCAVGMCEEGGLLAGTVAVRKTAVDLSVLSRTLLRSPGSDVRRVGEHGGDGAVKVSDSCPPPSGTPAPKQLLGGTAVEVVAEEIAGGKDHAVPLGSPGTIGVEARVAETSATCADVCAKSAGGELVRWLPNQRGSALPGADHSQAGEDNGAMEHPGCTGPGSWDRDALTR